MSKVYYEFALVNSSKIKEEDVSYLLSSEGSTSVKSVMYMFTSATDYSVYLEIENTQVIDFYSFITTQANSILHFLNNQFKIRSGFLGNNSLVVVKSTKSQKNPVFYTKLNNSLLLIVRPASLKYLKDCSMIKKQK